MCQRLGRLLCSPSKKSMPCNSKAVLQIWTILDAWRFREYENALMQDGGHGLHQLPEMLHLAPQLPLRLALHFHLSVALRLALRLASQLALQLALALHLHPSAVALSAQTRSEAEPRTEA